LDHPNIVRGYDVGQEQNQHFFVMEYVDGCSLQELIQKEGPLPIDRAVDYIRQAAVGLQHAHERGLVHRDIKPGNLLVDKSGTVKILDMGLSRFYTLDESQLTRDVLGTLDYLPPEQAVDSHTVDVRADIYSLGGTFYYLLTGHSPLTSDALDPVAVARQTNRPRPIRELRPEVPDALVNIIGRMMAHDPLKRFPNTESVANALELWRRGEVMLPLDETPPPPAPTRPMIPRTALADRSSAFFWAIIGSCVLAALGIGILLWQVLVR
jgi:serine/threonine protein kinase